MFIYNVTSKNKLVDSRNVGRMDEQRTYTGDNGNALLHTLSASQIT